jgi:nicotinate-nucleotide adenylyltransferase
VAAGARAFRPTVEEVAGGAGPHSYTPGVRSGVGIGIFGGTFDPPHVGHVVAAAAARHGLGLDRVLLTVANRPWQKVGTRPISPAADRLAMVGALVEGVEGLDPSAIEIERGGDSYTADTITEVRRRHGGAPVYVIVGSDAAGGIETWKRADEVRDTSTVVLVDRPGVASPPLPVGWTFVRVDIPRLDVSSTDIRRRVEAGEPIDGLVPPGVRSVIVDRGLYR